MAEVELIGVPFDGYGRTGNQARAAKVLREAGLIAAFEGHVVAAVDELDLPPPIARRGARTGLINEPALMAMIDALNERVGQAVSDRRFAVVYGGDCSSLLGTVTGLRDRLGIVGLVFVDGHEDTMPLDVSEDGEAANTELGLLLGITGRLLTGPFRDRLPALRSRHSPCSDRATQRGGAGSTSARSQTRTSGCVPTATSRQTRSKRVERRCTMCRDG